MKNRQKIIGALRYPFLVIGLICILIPLYVTLITALKTPAESSANFFALPASLYLENFKKILANTGFSTYVFNSFLITAGALIGIVIFLPMLSYAIARNMKKKVLPLSIYILHYRNFHSVPGHNDPGHQIDD